MRVDAASVPPSLMLAIVATLGSVALLSFLLRVWANGGGLRGRDADVWVSGSAVVSSVIVLVREEEQN